MSDPVLLCRDESGVFRLLLNRPARKNALNLEMWRLIPLLLAQAADDTGCKVLIVQGAGQTFAAGADIAEFDSVYATRQSTIEYAAAISHAMEGLAGFPKPTIALIQGPCVGGGLGLALACDLRFAATDSRLGITPARLGLVYPLGDTRRLVQTVGPSAAKDLLFTGRLLGAEEARAMGLVDRVYEPVEMDAAVRTCAEEICGASQWSVRAAKRMIARVLAGQTTDSPDSLAEFPDAVEGADFQEGRRAFLEKRRPRFPFR